jgi:hypothetical protein
MITEGDSEALDWFYKVVRLKCLGMINLATEYEHIKKLDLALLVYEDLKGILNKYMS